MHTFALPTYISTTKTHTITLIPLTGPYLIHALASPLTVLETLKNDPTLLSSQQGTAALKASVSHLKELIHQKQTSVCATQLSQALSTAVVLAKTKFPDAQYTLNNSPLTPSTIPIPLPTLTEVLLCLITNASQAYRCSDVKKINIAYTQSPQAIQISVKDQGVGMSLWQKLSCTKFGYTNKKTGWGVGLATVNQILKNCHGKLQINSKKGTGTTVTLQIPTTYVQR